MYLRLGQKQKTALGAPVVPRKKEGTAGVLLVPLLHQQRKKRGRGLVAPADCCAREEEAASCCCCAREEEGKLVLLLRQGRGRQVAAAAAQVDATAAPRKGRAPASVASENTHTHQAERFKTKKESY